MKMIALLSEIDTETTTTTGSRLLLAEPGREMLDDYLARGGYASVGWHHSPAELIRLVEASGLRGRGGAGFPTGAKLRAVAEEPGPRLVMINGAESEPASAKDRALLLTRPHLVIEGALLAAHATGADEVVLYVHDDQLKQSIDRARKELKKAGARLPRWHSITAPRAYVAGEASAAISYVNGRAAKPTTK